MRNIVWSEEELVLALDFYFQHGGAEFRKNQAAVDGLSKLLRKLGKKLHGEVPKNYRSEGSVMLRMGNFRSLDPQYTGKALPHTGKADKPFWNRHAHDREKLRELAKKIRADVNSD